MERAPILACLRLGDQALTTLEVAERLGAEHHRVQVEMLLMHNEGVLEFAGRREVNGRQRPSYRLRGDCREAIVYGMPSLRRAVFGK